MRLSHVIVSAFLALLWSLLAMCIGAAVNWPPLLCFTVTFLVSFNIAVLAFSLACMAGRNSLEE